MVDNDKYISKTDDTVSLDVGRLIQQGRQQKSWTQKELATVSEYIFCTLECLAVPTFHWFMSFTENK